ncbi:hypothetical protein GMOD_00007086 [Pyrenophora seminiperda CCB06]|uniref:Uncharacterized protein n=1 Tax=Pyrenophora seminiperda CCB06 TaxID=1302712 RepID=A0A3M7MCA4_9PLEO|nr:hypothetical protein GMOD_00007086 [Pyrenophora seminiperda CCB06]
MVITGNANGLCAAHVHTRDLLRFPPVIVSTDVAWQSWVQSSSGISPSQALRNKTIPVSAGISSFGLALPRPPAAEPSYLVTPPQ